MPLGYVVRGERGRYDYPPFGARFGLLWLNIQCEYTSS